MFRIIRTAKNTFNLFESVFLCYYRNMSDNYNVNKINKSASSRSKNRRIKLVLGIMLSMIIILGISLLSVIYYYQKRIELLSAEIKSGVRDEIIEELKSEGLLFTEAVVVEDEIDPEEEAAIRQDSYEEFRNTLRTLMEGEDATTANMLREFFPEKIIAFYKGQYHFLDYNGNEKLNEYNNDLFVADDRGRINYEDENYQCYTGIDVAKFQGNIDWEKVKNDGIDFALLRVAVRGYTKGALSIDDKYEYNMENATKQGLHVGAYVFTQAKNKAEMDEEIDMVLENVEGYAFDGPIVLDVEDVENGGGRTKDLTKEERTELVRYFCDRIRQAGYEPMLYGNLITCAIMLDMGELTDVDLWYAYYSEPLYAPYDFDIWQYTDSAKVSGIKGKVDMNIMLRSWWE